MPKMLVLRKCIFYFLYYGFQKVKLRCHCSFCTIALHMFTCKIKIIYGPVFAVLGKYKILHLIIYKTVFM